MHVRQRAESLLQVSATKKLFNKMKEKGKKENQPENCQHESKSVSFKQTCLSDLVMEGKPIYMK